jgi:hypothetical protein
MLRWVVVIPLLLAAAIGLIAPVAADQGSDEFAAVDAHALAAPASATASTSSLSAYLTNPARDPSTSIGVALSRSKGDEREVVRAIFRWITANIAYDASAKTASWDPQLVLTRRRAVCYGYAALFKALANAAGMKAEIIIGHSPKFKHDSAGKPHDWLNHAWNAVEVAGRWQLVDCCWGAGYLDERGRFVRSFTPHYLLTAPQVFVCDHLPQDPRWQLLHPPISRDDYAQRVQVRPPFFKYGLQLVSHLSAAIETDGPLAVTINAPAETVLTASLYRNEQELEQKYTFAQRDAAGYVIYALFPAKGAYVLRIFARRADTPGDEYEWALDYAVRARSGEDRVAGFPKAYGAFLTHKCRVEGSVARTLRGGDTADFCVTVPSAQDVLLATGGSLIRLAAEGGRFAGKVAVAPGPVVIFAKFAGESAYEGLLEYTAQ